VDALQKEVQSLEEQAAAAAGGLTSDAQQALETGLPALEQRAGEARNDAHQEMEERTSGLRSELDELETQGFDPLESLLNGEQERFEHWTSEADTALERLLVEQEAAAAEVASAFEQAGEQLRAAEEAVEDEHASLSSSLGRSLYDFYDLPDEVTSRCDQTGASVATWIRDVWSDSIRVTVTVDRGFVENLGRDTGAALEEEGRRAAEVVELATGALEQARAELALGAVAAAAVAPEAAGIDDLCPRLQAADREVDEIRALMDVVGQ
jgi:hypothetical protein